MKLEIFADNHLIRMHDEQGDQPGDIPDEALPRMLHTGDEGFTILTASGWTVNVDLDVVDAPPEPDLDRWEHVVEGGFTSDSGRLVVEVTGAPDDPVVDVPAGPLTVRVHGAGFAEAREADDGLDHYRVLIWPGETGDVTVLKQSEEVAL